jgi:hypothetical protein
MLANANPLGSFPSMLAPTGAFGGFALNPSKDSEAGSTALGVSTAAAPLISAPATRQTPGFQASIAPPTRPTDPSIAPPKSSESEGKPLSGTGSQMQGTLAKLAYIAAMKLEMASSGGNGAAGTRESVLQMAGASGK